MLADCLKWYMEELCSCSLLRSLGFLKQTFLSVSRGLPGGNSSQAQRMLELGKLSLLVQSPVSCVGNWDQRYWDLIISSAGHDQNPSLLLTSLVFFFPPPAFKVYTVFTTSKFFSSGCLLLEMSAIIPFCSEIISKATPLFFGYHPFICTIIMLNKKTITIYS